jgi:phage terminase small subunit
MDTTLTFRQERFVLEYLKDQNASAAAARAGYTAKNMASQGNELMKMPAVRERVRLEMAGLLSELRCSALELMKQRARIAFFRVDKMFAQGWEPLPLDQLDEETRLVLEVSTVLRKNGPVTKVKHPDRNKALRALEKVHETMDRLNEQHYARLEKAGMLPSLEEIEAMDGGGIGDERIPDPAISEIPQVLSGLGAGVGGSTASFDRLRTNGVVGGVVDGAAHAAAGNMVNDAPNGSAIISGKPQVLSGSPAQTAKTEPAAIPEKPQVLSGAKKICVPRVMPQRFAEKPQVLSGSARVGQAELAAA